MFAIMLFAALAGPAPPVLPPIHRVDLWECCISCKSRSGLHCRWYIFDDHGSVRGSLGPEVTFCRKCLVEKQQLSLSSNSSWVPYLLP